MGLVGFSVGQSTGWSVGRLFNQCVRSINMQRVCSCCGVRTLETVIHKMEDRAQDLNELQSQVGLKHTAIITEREMAADARDQTLKCVYLFRMARLSLPCLLYTSDAADE